MISDAERIVGLYQRHAHAWAADRGNRLFEGAWLDRFRNLLPAGAALLDIGCGSGEPIARYLIEKGYAVTGVDSSPEMIALCKGHFPGGDWRVEDMRALALDRAFNGILAWDSFFHLCHEDQRRMFSIFRKHAAPGAALMFTSGTGHGIAMGSFRGEPLYHASLDPAEYRALLDAQGFEVVAHVVEDPDCGRRTIWLAQLG
jgi:SAM-dependent methyltransferase